MQWQNLTAYSKPKVPCVLARLWEGRIDRLHVVSSDIQLEATFRYFRRDYNRFLELPEVK
jgi:hypothetical protein